MEGIAQAVLDAVCHDLHELIGFLLSGRCLSGRAGLISSALCRALLNLGDLRLVSLVALSLEIALKAL